MSAVAGQTLAGLDGGRIEGLSEGAGEPGWLRKLRADSLAVYEGLPLETSPLYTKYTDARRMDPAKVSLSDSAPSSPPAFLGRRLGELEDAACAVQVGTGVIRAHVPERLRDSGLVVAPVRDAVRDHPELVRRALESADPGDDKFTALNNAAFDSGVLVHVPRNADIREPVHLLACLPEDGTSAISRNIVAAGEGSRSSIVQEVYSPASGEQAYIEMLGADVADNARLDVTTLQMMGPGAVNFSTRRASLGREARLNWYSGLFGSALSRYRTAYFLRGPGAAVGDSEVAFGSADQSFDIQTSMNHEAPQTEGRVVEKSILRGRSRSLFKGMIRIMEGASKSNSFLSGRSILLDPDAKSDAIPGLEILTNDVKATHSASVAQIDEEQIFYLKSRCLSHEEAERTIVEGFLEPLSRRMSIRVRAWIAYLVESKWEGRELSINTDEELARFVEVEETRYNEDAEMEQHYKYR